MDRIRLKFSHSLSLLVLRDLQVLQAQLDLPDPQEATAQMGQTVVPGQPDLRGHREEQAQPDLLVLPPDSALLLLVQAL